MPPTEHMIRAEYGPMPILDVAQVAGFANACGAVAELYVELGDDDAADLHFRAEEAAHTLTLTALLIQDRERPVGVSGAMAVARGISKRIIL